MKKILLIATLLLIFTNLITAKELKTKFFDVNRTVKTTADLKNFVNFELPKVISIKNSSIKGELLGTNEISGMKIHKIQWSYNGVPVEGRYSVIKEKNGKILNVINSLKEFSLSVKPVFSATEAAKTVSFQNNGNIAKTLDFISNLIIIERFGKYRLAYKIRFRPSSILDGRFYYVDAHDGSYLGGGNFVMKATENTAKVFETNPIRDKNPVEVELPWVADDADGKLTSEIDDMGIRKVVASNCLDLGDTMDYYGSLYPICTPTQRANKIDNGNFIYEDWASGLSYKFDAEDNYSEVAVYYHMTKVYKYLIDLGLKDFTHLATHKKGQELNPIIGVGNFQMPQSTTALAPMDNAFYSPHDPYFKDMFFQNFEYEGDIIVLGQGQKADFAYDGDVIYHEFGHATIEGTAKLDYAAFPDKYGYSNETLGINEGMADTFSFMVSGDPCLGEYVSEAYGARYGYEKIDGFYCLRHAENDELVNESFTGESHHDGLPAVSAHWLIYQATLDKGFDMEDFSRFFMSALLSITASDLDYEGWGEILLKTVKETDLSSLEAEFQEILENKGFFSEIRARNVMNKADYLFSGGIAQYQGMPANTLKVDIEGDETEVAPMYVQLYYDVPECVDTLKITGMATDGQSMNSSSAPKYSLLVRKEKPLIWVFDDYPNTVAYDSYVTGKDEWIVQGLESGKRYYFQFINTGPEGMLYSPRAEGSWTSSNECNAETADDETGDLADETNDDDETLEDDQINPVKEDKNSGCSLIVL